MRALLSINTYDKDAYVDHWVRQAQTLDRSRWRLQVVKNGPTDVTWDSGGWETVRCANAPEPLGYRMALSATRVPSDIDAIVSVHAKSWLPDLGLAVRHGGGPGQGRRTAGT